MMRTVRFGFASRGCTSWPVHEGDVSRGHASRQGFALLAALWLIVAIATIALEFSLQSHQRRETTIDLAERTQAMAAAMAGVETERARFDQLNKELQQNQSIPGIDSRYPQLSMIALLRMGDSGSVGTGRFSAHVENGGAWLNINAMSEDMWRQFLVAAGVDYDTADRLAQTIMDWRDPDDQPRARGAEAPAYEQAGALVLPANQNFASVNELQNVLGMTPAIYAKIQPYLSVCTSGHVDIDDAPAPVLYAIPGFNDEIVSTVLSERISLPFNSGLNGLESRVSASAKQSLSANSQAINTVTNFSTPWEYVIVSTGWSVGGTTQVRVKARIQTGNTGEARTLWSCEE